MNDETVALNKHIGSRLRRRRRLLGLTQAQLGDAIKIRFQQIQKYESGANRMLASRLYEIAMVLSVPVGYFFEGWGERSGKVIDLNGESPDAMLTRASRLLHEVHKRITL